MYLPGKAGQQPSGRSSAARARMYTTLHMEGVPASQGLGSFVPFCMHVVAGGFVQISVRKEGLISEQDFGRWKMQGTDENNFWAAFCQH